MSSVYKAQNLVLNRTVAIKILSGNRNLNEQSLMRFQQEARAASQLDHPGIVKVHDFSVSTDQTPYMVMDYFDGNSISELISTDGPMDSYRAIDLILQACDALEHAHQKGVVHRDLKPSNIMVTRQKDGTELAKIVDFGVAKFLEEEHASAPHLTRTGEVFGSPLYMSPEQCLGKKVDARSDIYSLACVLYEELTGGPPFRSNNLLATMQMHIADPPPELTKERSDLPNGARLSSILLTALAKTPEQRFQSMRDFASALNEAALKPSSGMLGKLLTRLNIVRQVQGSNRNLPVVIVSLTAGVFVAITAFWAWQSNVALEELKSKSQSQALIARSREVESPNTIIKQVIVTPPKSKIWEPTDAQLIKFLTTYDPPRLDIEHGTNLTNACVPAIVKEPNLTILFLRKSNIDANGFKNITSGLKDQLTKLSLSGNRQLEPDDIRQIIGNCTKLVQISAQGIRTNDEVVASFAKFKNLNCLEISFSDITSRVFKRYPVNKSMTKIMMNNTSINAQTLHDVAQKFPMLSELHIRNTLITDRDLAALKTLPLKDLYVQNCRLSDKALSQLKQSIGPELRIVR